MGERVENTVVSPTAREDIKTTESQLDLEVYLQNLPKEKRHRDDIYHFCHQGFWYPSFAINSVIAFQQNFQAYHTDLILASAPKSGTTWLKALTFTITNRTKHPLHQSPLLTSKPHQCVPSLELQIYAIENNPSAELEAIPKPRILSTHVPYAALPSSINDGSGCRIVYICRNPMDQLISDWQFTAKSASLEEIFSKFCSGISGFGPFWDHVLGYWKASQERPNKVLFLKYEDLMEDAVFHTKALAEFLGFPFSEEEERQGVVEEVTRFCSFGHLKDLEVNKTGKFIHGFENKDFFRKAKVGDWCNYLTPPMVDYMEKLIQEKFEGSGLTFKTS